MEQTKQEQDQKEQTVYIPKDVYKICFALDVVLKARAGANECRDQLQNLFVEADRFWCTDGRRVHICGDISLLPGSFTPGAYSVEGSKAAGYMFTRQPYVQGPDIDKVIPNFTLAGAFSYDLDVKKVDLMQAVSSVMSKLAIKTKHGFNYKYIADLQGFYYQFQYETDIPEGKESRSKPIKITSAGSDIMAVIMPFRLDY